MTDYHYETDHGNDSVIKPILKALVALIVIALVILALCLTAVKAFG
jgi:hypothetical protein